MIRAILVVVACVAHFGALAQTSRPACRIEWYGVLASSEGGSVVPNASSPTGTERRAVTATYNSADKTSRVVGRLGENFGVKRKLINIPEGETVEFVITHPVITNPAGERFTQTVMQTSPKAKANTYRFTYPYTIVLGEWVFEFRYNGRSLCRHTFQVLSPRPGKQTVLDVSPNPSMERTAKSTLRMLLAAAHVER